MVVCSSPVLLRTGHVFGDVDRDRVRSLLLRSPLMRLSLDLLALFPCRIRVAAVLDLLEYRTGKRRGRHVDHLHVKLVEADWIGTAI